MSISITTHKETRQPPNRGAQDREAVARRAYQLWQAEGQPAGRDLDYWLRAEAQIQSGQPFRSPASMTAPGATSNGETAGRLAPSTRPSGKQKAEQHLPGLRIDQNPKQPRSKTGTKPSKTAE
jgi:hypothetical protein